MTLPRWLLGCVASLAMIGCAHLSRSPSVPAEHSVVLDQLIIHSNFPLPQRHRLLEELTAQRGALSTKLGLPVSDEPIHVYLFSTAEELRAYAHVHYPTSPQRRAFFVETDTRLAVYAYWGDYIAEDLRHEVAHGYLHAVVRNLPLWLDEGLAEYFEVPRGHHGLNQPHIAELNARRPLGWRPDLVRLEQFQDAGEMKQVDYAEAWAWVHFLLETTPERRQLLCGYLHTLDRTDLPEPLSNYLTRAGLNDPKLLADYVASLAGALQ